MEKSEMSGVEADCSENRCENVTVGVKLGIGH